MLVGTPFFPHVLNGVKQDLVELFFLHIMLVFMSLEYCQVLIQILNTGVQSLHWLWARFLHIILYISCLLYNSIRRVKVVM